MSKLREKNSVYLANSYSHVLLIHVLVNWHTGMFQAFIYEYSGTSIPQYNKQVSLPSKYYSRPYCMKKNLNIMKPCL